MRSVAVVLLAALAVASSAHADRPIPGTRFDQGEAREIARRFAQDWADLLDSHVKVLGCQADGRLSYACPVAVTGPTVCSMLVYVWKTEPHVYYSRARKVRCAPRTP